MKKDLPKRTISVWFSRQVVRLPTLSLLRVSKGVFEVKQTVLYYQSLNKGDANSRTHSLPISLFLSLSFLCLAHYISFPLSLS